MDPFSLPSFYLSAPTSPSSSSPQNLQFYSTRSSPLNQVFNQDQTSEDEFDFGTSHILTNERDKDEDEKYKLPARSNSFSTIAYADDLFHNGQVLPLKLPPRLQRSAPNSPRSQSARIKNPFLQQCTWNDDFDPFMIALGKVSKERMSVDTRSRSYSPFSARNVNREEEQPQHTKPDRELEEKEPKAKEMILERKGSMYSKFVRSQTMIKSQSPRARTMIKRLGRRVRDANFGDKETLKPMKESKMQKVKSVLIRYASLKKETNEKREIMSISKVSYLKRLSLSFKTNMRKKELVESNMAIVKHEKESTRCFGYGPRNSMMKRALRIS